MFPNCPYTANNLSVHYWYWTSKDQNKEANREREGKLGGWRVDQLEELRRVGSKVEAMLEEGEAGGGARSMGHAKLLHSVWLKLHPESQETEESLAEVIVLHHHGKELSIISFFRYLLPPDNLRPRQVPADQAGKRP